MFAIAFDLVVKDAANHPPKGVSAAYAEIGAALAEYGFCRVQGIMRGFCSQPRKPGIFF